jgi:hypothetical protein
MRCLGIYISTTGASFLPEIYFILFYSFQGEMSLRLDPDSTAPRLNLFVVTTSLYQSYVAAFQYNCWVTFTSQRIRL